MTGKIQGAKLPGAFNVRLQVTNGDGNSEPLLHACLQSDTATWTSPRLE